MNKYTVTKATQGLANYIIKKGGQEKGVAIDFVIEEKDNKEPNYAYLDLESENGFKLKLGTTSIGGGAIEIIDNETALITKNGKKLKVRISTNAPGCTLTAEKAESLPTSPKFNMTENTGVTKLSLHTEKASGDVSITVKMALVGELGSDTAVDTSPISEW